MNLTPPHKVTYKGSNKTLKIHSAALENYPTRYIFLVIEPHNPAASKRFCLQPVLVNEPLQLSNTHIFEEPPDEGRIQTSLNRLESVLPYSSKRNYKR